MNIDNLVDIDSDSDIENPTDYNEMFDKLSLEYYPEPFDTMGQIIMTAITGASISYLIKLKENKPITYITDIETYFKYCKNSPDDNYVNEILSKFNLTDTNNIKFSIIMDNIKDISINLMKTFIDNNIDLFDKHKSKSEKDFNIDLFNADIIKILIPMIKYSLISDIKSK